ncbi:MAG: dihydroorotase [Coriobacteriales bacterium]
MALLLKNAHVIDPQNDIDEVTDVLVRDGLVVAVGTDIELPEKLLVKDCAGKYLIPGMVDVHVHFRDPGQEYKEDILTGMRSAAHGGFTGVVPMANTKPVIDTGAMIEYLLEKAAWEPGRTHIYPLGACTKGLAGAELAEMGDMVAAGAVAFSDDGHGIQDGGMMRQVLDYAKMFDAPVLSHCQMEDIVGAGVVNEGVVSTRLGLTGWPAAGEETQIARDIELARLTGCHVHIQHLTTARAVDMVARAKAEGVPVTCEVTPHHLFLNEDDIKADSYSTNLKMNPPLRTKEDNIALQEALIDGRIDMVATDHAPHAAHEKALEFNHAPFGTTGLETALGLLLTHLVLPGKMSWQRLVEVTSIAPRELIGVEQVELVEGSTADYTIIDPELAWTVEEDDFYSRSKNSAFLGQELTGRATDVFVDGYASMEDGVVTF